MRLMSGAAGRRRSGGAGGSRPARVTTWRERENNRLREQRRRAVAAKIFRGLRTHGNYPLPRTCDNNEVLKALCREAGFTVEADGTTYRMPPLGATGRANPPPATHEYAAIFGSATGSRCPSSPMSPLKSFNPSSASGSSSRIMLGGGSSSGNFSFPGLGSSSDSFSFAAGGSSSNHFAFPGGGSSSNILSFAGAGSSSTFSFAVGGSNTNNLSFPGIGSSAGDSGADKSSSYDFLPWLKALSAASKPPLPSFGTAFFSAPATPPTSSPPITPRHNIASWADNRARAGIFALPPRATGASGSRYAPYTAARSSDRRRRDPADPANLLAAFQRNLAKGKAPALSLMPPPPSPSRLRIEGPSTRPHSPAAVPQGSAAVASADGEGDARMTENEPIECVLTLGGGPSMVSAWDGEVIKDGATDDLELTLGNSKTRADRA